MPLPARRPIGGGSLSRTGGARAAAAVGLTIVAAALSAQEPSFRSGARLVRLDISVLDGQKQPVRDLTASDFQITERGKPLTVRAFQKVAVPAIESARQTSPISEGQLVAPALLPAVASVEQGPTSINPGRLIVLVMDDDMTPAEPKWARQGRSIARSVIERMGPNDRIAIQFTRVATTRLEMTTDRAALLAAVETFSPGGFLAVPPSDTGADEVPRYRRSMAAFEFTTDALARLTDRQKMIVYVGPGIPVNQDAPARTGGAQGSVLTAYHGDFVLRMTELFRDAERANVVVYTFDPTGSDTLQDYAYDRFFLSARSKPAPYNMTASAASETAQRRARETAQWTTGFSSSVAENTGGRALIRSDNFQPAVDQMFADTSFYYLIAVEPLGATPDGRFHEVTVKVNRPGVDVRARRGYYFNP